jgi:hypothetical protein
MHLQSRRQEKPAGTDDSSTSISSLQENHSACPIELVWFDSAYGKAVAGHAVSLHDADSSGAAGVVSCNSF